MFLQVEMSSFLLTFSSCWSLHYFPNFRTLGIILQWREYDFCCFWWNFLSATFPGPDCRVGRKLWFMIQALPFKKGFLTSSKAWMSCTVFLPAAVESSWFKDRICFEISLNQACRFSTNTEIRGHCWDPSIPGAVALNLFRSPLQIEVLFTELSLCTWHHPQGFSTQ